MNFGRERLLSRLTSSGEHPSNASRDPRPFAERTSSAPRDSVGQMQNRVGLVGSVRISRSVSGPENDYSDEISTRHHRIGELALQACIECVQIDALSPRLERNDRGDRSHSFRRNAHYRRLRAPRRRSHLRVLRASVFVRATNKPASVI